MARGKVKQVEPVSLMNQAIGAIDAVFSDTSVSRAETRERLEELRDLITESLEALHEDEARAEAKDEDEEA